MQIITLEAVLQGLEGAWFAFSSIKDAFAGALIGNIGNATAHLFDGGWYWPLALLGGLYMAWKLKSWVVGLFLKNLV